MKRSQSTVPARATATLAVGLIAVPAALASSHPAVSHKATAARPPRGPGLSVSVSDGHAAARAGDKLTYTVTVRNTGTAAAPRLQVTQTLSAGLKILSASGHGAARGGQVSWPVSLPAGGMRTFRVVARAAKAPAGLLRLSAVACVAPPGSSRPVVCAADLDRTPAAAAESASGSGHPGSSVLTLTYAAAGLGALALGVLAAVAARRRGRRRRPSAAPFRPDNSAGSSGLSPAALPQRVPPHDGDGREG